MTIPDTLAARPPENSASVHLCHPIAMFEGACLLNIHPYLSVLEMFLLEPLSQAGFDLCSTPLLLCRWFFVFSFFFLGPYLWHMEVPRLGVQLELQLLAYTTAIATSDPSHICNLHHSSQQCRILNPLSEARDQTNNLMVPSQICFHCAMTGTPVLFLITPLLSYSSHTM